MSIEEERLVVLLEARIRDFEKRMEQAERRGTRTYTRLQADSAKATAAMEADMVRSSGRINQALGNVSATIGAFGRGFVGGVAGGIAAMGLSGIAQAARDAAREIAAIGGEADRAGVSLTAFQEWKYVAEQNRIGIDTMIDGLKELNLRADEFVVTGAGPAAEAFRRLGYTAEDLREKLKDPSALLLEIIGRLGELDRAAQIRIADEIFGGSAGERFVELIGQGEEGIRRTIDEAHNLGLVMDEELIRKAQDLDAVFNQVTSTVGNALKSAIVSAAAALYDFLRLWRDYEQQRSQSLEGQLGTITAEKAALAEERAALETDAGLTGTAKDLGFGSGGAVTQSRIAALQQRIDALAAQEAEINAVLLSRQPVPEPAGPTFTPAATPAATSAATATPQTGGRSGGGAAGRADELDREVEAIVKRTAAIEAATAAQGQINPLLADFGYSAEKARAAQELLVAAQQAGVEITPQLRSEIEALAERYATVAAASQQLREAQAEAVTQERELAAFRQETLGGFARDLLAGKDAADALAKALQRVSDRLLDMALDSLFTGQGGGGQGGGGGGLVSGLVAGIGSLFGFASGTGNTGGRRGQVRGLVHGQEAVIPLPAGGKVPVQLTGAGAPAAAAAQRVRVQTSISVGVTVDDTGQLQAYVRGVATREAQAATLTGLRSYDARLGDRLAELGRDPRYRG